MFTLKEIVKITGGRGIFLDSRGKYRAIKEPHLNQALHQRFLRADLKAKGISTDSRTIRKGELFIAIKGKHFDGSAFINEAKRKGAIGTVGPEGVKAISGFPLIEVKDTQKALGSIAKAHRDRFSIPIIAIAGSNGKTTTKDMIARILKERFKVLKTNENENNKIGVARTLLGLKDQEVAVIELGTDSCGEIKYHCDILRPEVAVITNIGPSHLQGLKDIKGVLKEKIALVESLGRDGTWIKNADDDMLSRAKVSEAPPRIITYGIKKKKLNFKAQNIKQTKSGIEFKLKTFLKHGPPCSNNVFDNATIALPIFGVHNVYNALAAVASCALFVDIQTMQKALSDFRGLEMRMQILHTNSFVVINDVYNSNPLSLGCAVSVLKDYPAFGRRIAVCADMLELGKDSERWHYQSGQLLAERGIDWLITFGNKSRHIAKGAIDNGMDKERVAMFRDKNKIISFLHSIIGKGDVVLIKGSRAMKMEEVLDCFTTCSIR